MCSYEAHYSSFHRNTCLECHRTFPSNFLLDLHILENHDVLFKLMSNAKYTVNSCFYRFRIYKCKCLISQIVRILLLPGSMRGGPSMGQLRPGGAIRILLKIYYLK